MLNNKRGVQSLRSWRCSQSLIPSSEQGQRHTVAEIGEFQGEHQDTSYPQWWYLPEYLQTQLSLHPGVRPWQLSTTCQVQGGIHIQDQVSLAHPTRCEEMSSDGSWSEHISIIVRRASLLSGWIFSVFRDRSPEVMLQLFKSLVRPILEYCCLVWDPTKPGDIKAIENVQRCFTRRLDGMQNLDYWARLKVLNLMSLQRRRQRYMLIHVWKTIHGFVPDSANLVFHGCGRLGMRLKPPPFPYWAETRRANQYHSSFGPRAARLWNMLPAAVNSCGSLGRFKSSLGNYLTGFNDRPPVSSQRLSVTSKV